MLDMVRSLSLLQKRRMRRTSKWRLMMRYWPKCFFIMNFNVRWRKLFWLMLCWSCSSHRRCGPLLGTQQEPSSLPWKENACWRLQVWLILQDVEKVSPTSKCPTSLHSRRSDYLKQRSDTLFCAFSVYGEWKHYCMCFSRMIRSHSLPKRQWLGQMLTWGGSL